MEKAATSIRTKIIGVVIGSVISVVVILVTIYVSEKHREMREIEARLIEDSLKSAAGLAYAVAPHLIENDYAFMDGLASQYARRSYRSYVMIVDNHNKILAHSSEAELGNSFEVPDTYKAEDIGGGLFQKYLHDGKMFYDVSYPIKAGDLVLGTVRIGLDTDWIKKEKDDMSKTILEFIGVAFAISIVSILGASGMTGKITGPLLHLARSAKEVGKGDFTQKVDVESGDEVGVLAESFNIMLEDLKRSRAKLVEKDYVDSIMAAMEDSLIVLSRAGLIATVNNFTLDLLGYKRGELVNQPVEIIVEEWLFGADEADDSTVAGMSTKNVEGTFRTKAGRKIPMLFSVSSLGGMFHEGLLLLGKDITERKKADEALRESERRYHALFDQSPDGILLINSEGKIVEFNESVHRRLGYSREEFSRLCVSDLDSFETAEDVKSRISKIMQDGKADFYIKHRTKQGEIRDVHVIAQVITLSGSPFSLAIWHDVTEIKNMRDRLEEKTAEQNAILENALVGIAFLKERRFIWINSRMEQMFGFQLNEVSGLTTEIFYPSREAYEEVGKEAYPLLAGGGIYTTERSMRRKDGSIFWCYLSGKAIDPAVLGKGSIWIMQDISERKRADEQIRLSLREKEVLLKEIHHRVKNNLQVVSSMLRLQADYVQDRKSRVLFEDSRRRVETMSIIHEKLYRSNDLARIDFKEYVSDLAANLALVSAGGADRVEVEIDVEGMMLDINSSIPCGLIINELVSNAFKHAFADGRKGKVIIGMRRVDKNRVVLLVSDDGAGFPEGLDFKNTSSLGLQLVNSLVTQLGGAITLDRGRGTCFRIEFEA